MKFHACVRSKPLANIPIKTKKKPFGYDLLTLNVEKIRLMLYFPAPFTMTSIRPPQMARSCMS